MTEMTARTVLLNLSGREQALICAALTSFIALAPDEVSHEEAEELRAVRDRVAGARPLGEAAERVGA